MDRIEAGVQRHHLHLRLTKTAGVPRLPRAAVSRPAAPAPAHHPPQETGLLPGRGRVEEDRVKTEGVPRLGPASTEEAGYQDH